MLKSGYIIGSPEDQAALKRQLDYLYTRKGLKVVGSIGRQAMYSHFEWCAQPLSLRYRNDPVSSRRDIGVITPNRFTSDSDARYHGFELDSDLNTYFNKYTPRPSLRINTEVKRQILPLHETVIRACTRYLDGMPVRTLKVGTQLLFDRLVHASLSSWDREDQAVYDQKLADFEAFAESIRQEHPVEFPDQELCRPFEEAIALYE